MRHRACPWRIPTEAEIERIRGCYDSRMRHLGVLLVHLITTVLKLIRPGGVRALVAESVLAKHPLLSSTVRVWPKNSNQTINVIFHKCFAPVPGAMRQTNKLFDSEVIKKRNTHGLLTVASAWGFAARLSEFRFARDTGHERSCSQNRGENERATVSERNPRISRRA